VNIHQRCDGHLRARYDDAGLPMMHVIFASCKQAQIKLPQRQDGPGRIATALIAAGVNAWYDKRERLNLMAEGVEGLVVFETLMDARAVEHALRPERLYVLGEGLKHPAVCHTLTRGLADLYTRVGNMLSVKDMWRSHDASSSLSTELLMVGVC
jgi:hypothetical protein